MKLFTLIAVDATIILRIRNPAPMSATQRRPRRSESEPIMDIRPRAPIDCLEYTRYSDCCRQCHSRYTPLQDLGLISWR